MLKLLLKKIYAKYFHISRIIKFESNLSNHPEICNIYGALNIFILNVWFVTLWFLLFSDKNIWKMFCKNSSTEFYLVCKNILNQTLNIRNWYKKLTIYLSKSCLSFTKILSFCQGKLCISLVKINNRTYKHAFIKD